MAKVYIAGPITGHPDYKERFAKAEQELREQGDIPLNPAMLPAGMGYEDYMHICFSMIDVADKVIFLEGWETSPGARRELAYTVSQKGDSAIIRR